jgi:hypothetical protein
VARAKTAEVALPDPTVSRKHGFIMYQEEGGFGRFFYQQTAGAGTYRMLGTQEWVPMEKGVTLEIGDNEYEVVRMDPGF